MPDGREFYIESKKQTIAQILLADTEYIVCTYPKVWSEKKYLIYVGERNGNKFEIHCFPQKSYLRVENEELFEALKEEWSFTLVSRKDTSHTKISPVYIQESDPILSDQEKKHAERIVNAVWVLTKLENDHKRKNQIIKKVDSADLFDVYHAFIGQLEHLLRDVKRSYRETTERTRVIRGRLSNRGRVNLVMRPSNRFECIFDEFVVQAPVYKIISTCLDIVLNADFHSSFLWLHKQFTEMRQQGQVHVRTLAGVEAFPRNLARSELRRLQRRLPRRFRSFEPLLPLMKKILDDDASQLIDQDELATSVRIVHEADSEKVWEKFLENGLKLFGHQVEDQAEYDRTWNVGGTKQLDILLNGGVELVDAKYYSKLREVRGSENQYQMFFYMFAQFALNMNDPDNKRPKRITLVYPLSDEEEEIQQETHVLEDERMGEIFTTLYTAVPQDQFPPLRTLGVPLPGPDVIEELSDTILHGGNWVKKYFEEYFSEFGAQFYRN